MELIFPEPGRTGDANDDRIISIVDALLIAQYSVEIGPAGFIQANAGGNCNGSIDSIAAVMIAQYVVGLLIKLRCWTE